MKTIALDLGTATGWALREGKALTSGTWKLGEFREAALWVNLCDINADHVVMEKPIAYPGRYQGTNVLMSLGGVVRLWCQQHDKPPPEEIPPATLKKAVSGVGNAPKSQVRECIKQLYPDQHIDTFDQADALGVLWAWEGVRR